MKVIDVKDIITSSIAVSPTKGELLYNLIKKSIENKEKIQLNFENIEQLTTAFFNSAIGSLYKSFTSDELNEYLTVYGLDELDKYLLSKVIIRAKLDVEDDEELNNVLKGEE